MSFWTYVPAGPVEPRAAGRALSEVHAALRQLRVSLPVLGHLTEAEALLARLAAEEAVDSSTADVLHDRLLELRGALAALRTPVQPIHGDAHLRNVLGGRLWNDWEDCAVGPVHWDAACLLAPSVVSGIDHGGREALDAAGLELDPGELALWIDARILQGAIWSLYVAREHGRDHSAWVSHALDRGP